MLVGHPLDLVKVRMQASTTSSLGVFATMQRTFVAEGARGLYRGVSAPLTATTPMFAVSFWSYDMGKRVVQMLSSPSENNGGKDFTFTIPQICMAGALSSFPTVTIMVRILRKYSFPNIFCCTNQYFYMTEFCNILLDYFYLQ